MKITIERNSAENANQTPYVACVEIVTATIAAGSVFELPISVSYAGSQKVFYVNLLGVRLEQEHPHALIEPIQKRILQLIHLARLPTYLFIARQTRTIFPVYTIGSEVTATTAGGPVFRHVELAKVREYLTDYLHEAGILGQPGLTDKLHVRGVNMHSLELRRPLFYLKKRVPNEVDFWAPVFESGDGRRIYAYAANERRQAPNANGREVLDLRDSVALALLEDGRLQDSLDLRPDRLFPAQWNALRASLVPEQPQIVQGLAFTQFRYGPLWLAVEPRPDEERFGLFLGHNQAELAQRIEVDFLRREKAPAV